MVKLLFEKLKIRQLFSPSGCYCSLIQEIDALIYLSSPVVISSDKYAQIAVGQTDNQQLMSAANLGAIDDQADLAQMSKLGCQPRSRNRLVFTVRPCETYYRGRWFESNCVHKSNRPMISGGF